MKKKVTMNEAIKQIIDECIANKRLKLDLSKQGISDITQCLNLEKCIIVTPIIKPVTRNI